MEKFIIGNDPNQVSNTKRAILMLVENLNYHLEAWGKTTLPNIKAENLSEFAANPKAYFDKAVIKQAKEKGMEGVVPGEFAKLFNITFIPNLQRYPMDTNYIEFVKLAKDNKVVPVPGYEDKIKDVGTVAISDPKQIEAAKLILDTFKKFTYIATMLSGNQMVQTAGTERIGFSLMNMGSINPDVVARLSEAMAKVPFTDWVQQLFDQFKNPGLVKENTTKKEEILV